MFGYYTFTIGTEYLFTRDTMISVSLADIIIFNLPMLGIFILISVILFVIKYILKRIRGNENQTESITIRN